MEAQPSSLQNTSAARWLDYERDLTRQMVALKMLEVLGPSAAAAVPDVEKLVADRVEILWCPTSYFALTTLKELGPTASPALADLRIKFNHAPCSIQRFKDIDKINSSTFTFTPTQPSDYYDHDYRLEIIAGIREIGVGASVAIPALVEALKATNAQVVVASVGLLAEIKQRPEIVVPALVDFINHPDQSVQERAVSAIGAFGKDARFAVAMLESLNDKSIKVRNTAKRAIRLINASATGREPVYGN